MGEEVEVNAAIHYIAGFSAHADQQELREWYHGIEGRPALVLTHGQEDSRQTLAGALRDEGIESYTPGNGDSINLLTLEGPPQ